jgi:hypothetical protein
MAQKKMKDKIIEALKGEELTSREILDKINKKYKKRGATMNEITNILRASEFEKLDKTVTVSYRLGQTHEMPYWRLKDEAALDN